MSDLDLDAELADLTLADVAPAPLELDCLARALGWLPDAGFNGGLVVVAVAVGVLAGLWWGVLAAGALTSASAALYARAGL